MQLALETKVDSLRGEINSMKHQLTTSQDTMDAEKAELQRELESAQQRLTLLQTQSEAQKVCICTYLYVYHVPLCVCTLYLHMYMCGCTPIFRDVSLGSVPQNVVHSYWSTRCMILFCSLHTLIHRRTCKQLSPAWNPNSHLKESSLMPLEKRQRLKRHRFRPFKKKQGQSPKGLKNKCNKSKSLKHHQQRWLKRTGNCYNRWKEWKPSACKYRNLLKQKKR